MFLPADKYNSLAKLSGLVMCTDHCLICLCLQGYTCGSLSVATFYSCLYGELYSVSLMLLFHSEIEM